jgi:hypothetical protein
MLPVSKQTLINEQIEVWKLQIGGLPTANIILVCKISDIHGDDSKECRHLGNTSVRTSRETHYLSTTEPIRCYPMLCEI